MASLWEWMYIRAIHYGLRAARIWCHWFFAVLNWGQSKSVPPVSNRLLLKSATLLAGDIRDGKVKSEDVIRAYVERIKEVEPYINATVEHRFQAAIAEAKDVDALIASGTQNSRRLAEDKPLLGVPFTVKCLMSVKGMGCTGGSLHFSEARAAEDAEVVRLMKESGAICLATTNTAEFGMGFETSNFIYGKTCNPYDTSKTSGGSSGGEGALVAAAGSVMGIGNDLAGSIRLPCFYNGIFGHKPSRGALSNTGIFPVPEPKIFDYLTPGPMCRYAEDLVTTMQVLSANSLMPMKFGNPVDFKKVKIYYNLPFGNFPGMPNLDAEYLKSFKEAIKYFETTHGIEVKELTYPSLSSAPLMILNCLINSTVNPTKVMTGGKGHIDGVVEMLKYFLGQSRFTLGPLIVMNFSKSPLFYSSSNVENYAKMQREMISDFESALDEDSVLLFPSFTQTAPYHYESNLLLPGVLYMSIFNVLGLPATQCTLGLNSKGMPLGLQVVGRRGNDPLTVAFAVEFEKAFGGWMPPNASCSKATTRTKQG